MRLFAIGGYVSQNSRNGRWGTGIIDEISCRLQKELPGLRGFSAQNMRNMRQFYEEWSSPAIRQSLTGKIGYDTSPESLDTGSMSVLEIRPPAEKRKVNEELENSCCDYCYR